MVEYATLQDITSDPPNESIEEPPPVPACADNSISETGQSKILFCPYTYNT